MKFSIELKILIALILGALVLWGIYTMGNDPMKTLKGVIEKGPNACMDNIDPIYTNALMSAGTYQIISKNIPQNEVAKTFWLTYLGKEVQSVKILKKERLTKKELSAYFKNYTFVNDNALEFLKKADYVKQTTNARALNTLISNYNISTIQTMLSAREEIPQFAAYKVDLTIKFKDGTSKNMMAIVTRAISSATGQPYKHLRWVVSEIR